MSRARVALIVALVVAAPACHSSSSPPAGTNAPAVAPVPADLATARDAATATRDLAAPRAHAPATRASGAGVTPPRAPAGPALMPVGSIKDGTLRYNLPNPIPAASPDAGVTHSPHRGK